MIVFIIMTVAFLIASYTDIKSGKIPIWLFPTAALISLVVEFCDGTLDILMSAIGGVAFFVLFVLIAMFAKGGGGDAIMMGCLGLVFGVLNVMRMVMVTGVIYIVFGIIIMLIKSKNKSFKNLMKSRFPYAPFAGAGYIVYTVLKIL